MKHIYTGKKKRRGLYSILLLLLFTAGITGIQAQITIGDGAAPQKFSILEIVSNKTGGLRLPQLTTEQRNTLTETKEFQNQKNRGDASASLNPGLGLGLTIFNTDTNCVEYWNGYKWVSLCLGTANIGLTSDCGDYNPENPPEANEDGNSPVCEYTPKDDSECTVSSGKAFEVYLTTGAAYTTLNVDEKTSAFSIIFQPNNKSQKRIAVVRVTNNCSGEFKDFIFTQKGSTCPEVDNPILNTTTLELCKTGSVFSQITNPKEGINYIWVYSGAVVHTGTWYEIKRPGTYKVYAGLIGCGTPATLTVTDKSGSNAPTAVNITTTNEGILCGNGNVILSANTSLPVVWYHEGVPLSGANKNNNPLTLSGAQMAGNWFAVVQDASGCVSNSSNVVTLIDMTDTSSALPAPVAKVNDQNISDNTIVICKNGTLKLEVTNANAYPEGTLFEWFSNGIPIEKSEKSVIYLVPPSTSNIILSVTASNPNGNCPNTAISQPIPVTFSAPSITAINNGAVKVAICDGKPANLIADHEGADAYEWMLNGITIVGKNGQTIQTDEEGDYTVRYKDTNSCWSQVSASTKVVKSGNPVLLWKIEPENAFKGETQTYTIVGPYNPKITYQWSWKSSDPDAIISITPIGDGTSAEIKYGKPQAASTEATIEVKSIGHICGDTTIKSTVTIAEGCRKITSASIIPSGNISLEQGKKFLFTANASNDNNNLQYEWFITAEGGTPVLKQGPSASDNFTYNADTTGNYTITVRATNDCTSEQDNVTTEALIKVKPSINGELDTSGNFKLSGNNCFDIAQSNFNKECGEQKIRKGDFLDSNRNWIEGKQWVYTFTTTNSAAYSNLQFVTSDPSVLIKTERTNSDGKTFTIVFDQSVLTKALGKNKDNALTVTIYALFQSGGKDKRIELKLNVQDCLCGCGAYTAPGVWKRFMCHNLGADETADPFTPSKKLYGDHYQWGYKEIAAYGPNNPENPDKLIIWRGPAPNYSWTDRLKSSQDPCPEGYRVPTASEWYEVANDEGLNPQSSVGTWSTSMYENNNFTAGRFLGKYLFLPATGRRTTDGRLAMRGQYGIYASSSANPPMWPTANYDVLQLSVSSDQAWVEPRDHPEEGYNIRCIEE